MRLYEIEMPEILNGKPTRNSLGKLIHTTEEGINNFWKWFGDSKVKDNKGRPLVVYHGSAKDGYVGSTDIQSFDKGSTGDRWGADSRGFFFTTAKDTANYYAKSDRDYYHPGESQGVVYYVYLKIENPLKIRSKDSISDWDDNQEKIQRKAELGNHDGIIMGDLFVAFESNQIKSAIGNNGKFSKSPNISEAAYPGNIGITEMVTFMQKASQELVDIFTGLMKEGETGKAMKIVQDFTGVKLMGKEFGNES